MNERGIDWMLCIKENAGDKAFRNFIKEHFDSQMLLSVSLTKLLIRLVEELKSKTMKSSLLKNLLFQKMLRFNLVLRWLQE